MLGVLSTKNLLQLDTGQYYLAVLERLMARIRRICPEDRTESSWCLKHDNAPNPTSLLVRQFLAKNNVCVFNHPLYSPELLFLSHLSWSYSLFPKIKKKLKGCYIEDILTLQITSTHALQAIPQSDLHKVFDSLINRYNKRIEAEGSSFE
ncbi:mariner Mos1 transposase [Trichonephila clavipes]|nr:mariner Mos1 transposase [Trichonephila clavipes]